MKTSFAASSVLLAAGSVVFGHALPTPVVTGQLQVRGNAMLNSDGTRFELLGVNLPLLSTASPPSSITFKVIRQRWNLNAVRLPVSIRSWEQQGESYLAAAARAVDSANNANVAVVLVARGESEQPTNSALAFWRVWADRFKSNDRVLFDIYDKPVASRIPGWTGTRREPVEWQFWLNGGQLTGNQTAVGMKQIVDTIRSTGANQVIAAQAYADAFGFQGFDPAYWVQAPNIIYEIHPTFDRTLSATERETQFGFLTPRLHLYAGEWGVELNRDSAACRRLPRDIEAVTDAVYGLLRYFDEKRMSWTASTFEPGSLITETETYANSKIQRPWTCGENSNPIQGMGELLLVAMTGDPTGFGELIPETIANAATGMVGPVAPGEIISIYGAEVGPYPGVPGEIDADGNLSTMIGRVRVLFDGIPAPVFYAYAYQVNVQVPYTVAGQSFTRAQLFYDDVPSSRIDLQVADASPGIFADLSKEAKALNQDGSLNSAASPAPPGSIVVLFGTGAGKMTTTRKAGSPAAAPFGSPSLPVSVKVGSADAEVLYAGEAPGLIGVIQLNVRVPVGPSGTRAVTRTVEFAVGPYASPSPVTIWVK